MQKSQQATSCFFGPFKSYWVFDKEMEHLYIYLWILSKVLFYLLVVMFFFPEFFKLQSSHTDLFPRLSLNPQSHLRSPSTRLGNDELQNVTLQSQCAKKDFITYDDLKRLGFFFLWLPFLQRHMNRFAAVWRTFKHNNIGERPFRSQRVVQKSSTAIWPSCNRDTFRWFSLHRCQNDPVTKEADLLTTEVNIVIIPHPLSCN